MELTKEEKAARFDEIVQALRGLAKRYTDGANEWRKTMATATTPYSIGYADGHVDCCERAANALNNVLNTFGTYANDTRTSRNADRSPDPVPPTLTDQEIRLKAVELVLAHSTRDGTATLFDMADKLVSYIKTGET